MTAHSVLFDIPDGSARAETRQPPPFFADLGLDRVIDAMIAGFSAILAVGASGHFPDIANHLRKIGAQAFTVFAFRKGYQAVKHEPLAGGTAPGVTRITLPGKGPGVTGEDPIEAVAKGLG